MNGNLKLIDNAKDARDKRYNFIQISNEVQDLLKKDSAAFNCYCMLIRRAGSEYNLTVKGAAHSIGLTPKTATKVLNKLVDLGLLERTAERDITGEVMIETEHGRVPNNCKRYVVYTLPKGTKQPGGVASSLQQSKQPMFKQEDFSTDDIQTSETEMAIELLPLRQTGKPANIGANIERRKQEILNIAKEKQLFSKNGQAKLLYWAERYKKRVGQAAEYEVIEYMANILSNDAYANFDRFIEKEALAASGGS